MVPLFWQYPRDTRGIFVRRAKFSMNTVELLEKKAELERQLADPVVLRDPEKIKELSIEYGRVERMLREAVAPHAAAGQKHERAIIEIRAGAGGHEAALFAGSLFRMYSNYGKKRGWDVTLIDASPTTIGGYKEAIFELSGLDAYTAMRHEAGVHRVQRIPETEKTGRVHTSTASVAVLEEAQESDVEVRPQDLKIEFFRSSGPGGQNVNKVETAVRIYHLPTGLVVSSQESRSQQKNREHAMTVLRAKLLDAKRQREAEKAGAARREQIGSADRSEKIRTYNFPQDRITDHRVKESWHNIESILEGNLDPIIDAFEKDTE